MKIYTKIESHWDGEKLVVDNEEFYWYDGPVALCCGASSDQKNISQQQQTAYQTMTQQASQVFGDSSQVFKQLQSTFAPIVAAGPSQQGFSPAEVSNLNSQVITQNGQSYKNAKAAVGNAIASEGGGNNPGLTSGVNVGIDASVANAAAANTSNQLSQVNEANWQTGRQNFDTATKALSGSTDVFNPVASLDNASTSGGNAASNTANEIASQNNSWIQGVTGALGGIAGAATGGLMKNIGSGKSTPTN